MVLSNVVFNYILIFGKFGFPALGIAGAAIGSSLAELDVYKRQVYWDTIVPLVFFHPRNFKQFSISRCLLYTSQESGYEVLVLTTTPHYNVVESHLAAQPLKWKVWGICKESCFHGIRVLHVPQKKFRNTFLRVLGRPQRPEPPWAPTDS